MLLHDVVAQGNARAVVSPRPRTISEILLAGKARMELEEAAEDWLAGRPVKQIRRPRRTLRQWLSGGIPEPAPHPGMTSVEPGLRSGGWWPRPGRPRLPPPRGASARRATGLAARGSEQRAPSS